MRRLDMECGVLEEHADEQPTDGGEPGHETLRENHSQSLFGKRRSPEKRREPDQKEERKERLAAFEAALSEHAGVPLEALAREFGLTAGEVSEVLAESVDDFPWLKDPANPNNIYVLTRRDTLVFLERLRGIGEDVEHPVAQRAKEVLEARGQRLERELTVVLGRGSTLIRPVMNRIEDLQVINPRVAMTFAKEVMRQGHPASETLLAHFREVGSVGGYLDLLELSGRQIASPTNELGLVLQSRLLVGAGRMDPVLRDDIRVLWAAQATPGEEASWAAHHIYDLGRLQREAWGPGTASEGVLVPLTRSEYLQLQSSSPAGDFGTLRVAAMFPRRPPADDIDLVVMRTIARLEGEHIEEGTRQVVAGALADLAGQHGGVWQYCLREAEVSHGTLPRGAILQGLASGLNAWKVEPDLYERAVRAMAYMAVREPYLDPNEVEGAYKEAGGGAYHPELSRVVRGYYRFGGGPDGPRSRALAVAALKGIASASQEVGARDVQGPRQKVIADLAYAEAHG